MKVKVMKVSDNEHTFKSKLDELDTLLYEPREGSSMFLFENGNPDNGIVTSYATFVEKTHNGYIVNTANSVYHIEVLDETGA